MRHDLAGDFILVAASILSGYIGWSGHVLLLPAACVFPVIWARASNRATAALVSAAYFLTASRGLPQGVAAFYTSDLFPGLLLWLAASLSFVLVHAVLWASDSAYLLVRYFLSLLLMALPPFGITGWGHPITAAGVLFPDWGWWGLIAMTAGLLGLVSTKWPAAATAIGGVWLWSAATWTELPVADGWRGVDVQMGASLGRKADLQHQRDLIAMVVDAADQGIRVVVLPESALGFWTPTVEHLWMEGLFGNEMTVIAGGAVVARIGYDNVLVVISRKGGRVLYRERMPVPGSMWQPWRIWFGEDGGANAHFFASPVVEVDGQRLAPLICYEQLLVWPVLQSMLGDPDVIVAVGNGWWTADSSIVAIQRASALAWARLFNKPLVISFNI